MPSANKAVHRKYQQKHYSAHKEYYKQKRQKRADTITQLFILFKATLKCCLCPESDPIALDFHHIDQTSKDLLISKVAQSGKSWAKIITEIEKCACLCANCHRKVHKHQDLAAQITPEHAIKVPPQFRQ